jgi:hypothetical protein
MNKYNNLVNYIKLHYISLNQDNDRIQDELNAIEDMNSDAYRFKEIEDISVSGQIISLGHVLKYINELDMSFTKGAE